MNAERRPEYTKPQDVAESVSKKVLAFLNVAQSANEIAGAVEFKGERDVGLKVAQSILDRRTRLDGFKNLSQLAATPQVGEVRFAQIVSALEARREFATIYTIEGQVKSAGKIEFTTEKLVVHALINGVELASAGVDARGKYKLTFNYREQPPATELCLLPTGVPLSSGQGLALTKIVSAARYATKKSGTYNAIHDLLVPLDYVKIWGTVTKNYHMHGVVYATTFLWGMPISVEPLPAAKIEFYEADVPFIWLFGTEPALTEAYLGHAYTAPDGSYDFTFNFSYKTGFYTWYWLFTDKVPDIRARISQFVDGLWKQVYEGPVDWNIVQDFHRDYFVPKEDVIPVPPGGVKPTEGFRFISLGLLPIDTTRIQLGYGTAQPSDPVAGISHQPFCGTLRIFGLFAESPPVVSYKVQIATADEDSVVGTWQDVGDPLYNRRWNDVSHVWEAMVLGPDPVTGRYQNIDTQPEADWHEHALKVTWNSANVNNGYYALRVIGYDAASTEVGTFQMPIVRVDNSLPEISLETIGTSVGAVTKCGALKLGLDRKIQFRVTAHDAEGHVKRYWLSGTRGKAATSAGATIQETRPDPANRWVGVSNKLVEFTIAALPADLVGCPAVAYNFELHARGLATDGYSAEPVSQWEERENNLVVAEP
jgi:hypothetical protein